MNGFFLRHVKMILKRNRCFLISAFKVNRKFFYFIEKKYKSEKKIMLHNVKYNRVFL